MDTLLHHVEAFMDENSLSASAFGDGALGDRHLVRQLRKGRRLWPETEAKVRDFMAAYTPTPTPEARHAA